MDVIPRAGATDTECGKGEKEGASGEVGATGEVDAVVDDLANEVARKVAAE
jgi:hypothetical protein